MTQPIELEPGTPIADAVTRALEAFERSDRDGVDSAYREAMALADSCELRAELAVDHTAKLLTLGDASRALRRCDEYLKSAPSLTLRLVRAEARSAVGAHRAAVEDMVAIRAMGPLTENQRARLLRVEGLAAADRGDMATAAQLLGAARQVFLAIGAQSGVEIIDRDRLVLAVLQGEQPAVEATLTESSPKTTADHLQLARALKRKLRYEEAFHVVLRAATARDLDPAMRVPVLAELIVLLYLTRQDEAAERLTPLLAEAAETSPDPVTAKQLLKRLSPDQLPGMEVSSRFDRVVQDARRLIDLTKFDQAEQLLDDLRARAVTNRERSTWHLAAGELELAGPNVDDAVGHLSKAAELANDEALAEVRMLALRKLGRACQRRAEDERANRYWSDAHRIEEHIAARQKSGDVRIRMLLAAPDEHDERVRAAAAALDDSGETAAGIVVAMEAARGATILNGILPGMVRDLPRMSDHVGAWLWLSDFTHDLPRSQVVWLMHATPERVHHAVIGRNLLRHVSVPYAPRELEAAVNELRACWDLIEASVAGGEFDGSLAEIAEQAGVRAVIPLLPKHIRRIAIVAGGVLSEVPFAAIRIPGTTDLIGHRFALSDLPCLAARRPLRRRSSNQRGERSLLLSPPDDALTQAEYVAGRTVLDGEHATPDELRSALEFLRHNEVRIDSHGEYDRDDPTKSWLQLAPAGPAGQLYPESLQDMDLRGCGTFVLGACESGMAHRKGRDERAGFVRAAVHAGAAAVVAARWVADDPVAAAVLDGFEHYLRYLPRDVALQRAQLDVCQGFPGADHPARWACWTLYGDSGWQTGAGSVRRLVRRQFDKRRHRALPV